MSKGIWSARERRKCLSFQIAAWDQTQSDPTGKITYGWVLLVLHQLVCKSSLSHIYDRIFSFDGIDPAK